MVWHFIGVCIINRILHGRLEIRNFSSCVKKKKFTSERSERVKYFSTTGKVWLQGLVWQREALFDGLLFKPFPRNVSLGTCGFGTQFVSLFLRAVLALACLETGAKLHSTTDAMLIFLPEQTTDQLRGFVKEIMHPDKHLWLREWIQIVKWDVLKVQWLPKLLHLFLNKLSG